MPLRPRRKEGNRDGEDDEKEAKIYQVVGESVISGLEDSSCLLSPLPHPWVLRVALGGAGRDVAWNEDTKTGEITDKDPRLAARSAPPGDGEWVWV